MNANDNISTDWSDGVQTVRAGWLSMDDDRIIHWVEWECRPGAGFVRVWSGITIPSRTAAFREWVGRCRAVAA